MLSWVFPQRAPITHPHPLQDLNLYVVVRMRVTFKSQCTQMQQHFREGQLYSTWCKCIKEVKDWTEPKRTAWMGSPLLFYFTFLSYLTVLIGASVTSLNKKAMTTSGFTSAATKYVQWGKTSDTYLSHYPQITEWETTQWFYMCQQRTRKPTNQDIYMHNPILDLHGMQPKNANGLVTNPQYTDI